MNYTAIGAVVSLTHQLESHTEPDQTLISHETYALVKEAIYCKQKDTITVQGFAHPIQIYEAFATAEPVTEPPSSSPLILEENGPGIAVSFNLDEIPETEKAPLLDFLETLMEKTQSQ